MAALAGALPAWLRGPPALSGCTGLPLWLRGPETNRTDARRLQTTRCMLLMNDGTARFPPSPAV
jgi:hypothetical protein